MPNSRRHQRRHVSEDGGETVEVENRIADGVLVDGDVAFVALVAVDQSLQGLGLEGAQRPRRGLGLESRCLIIHKMIIQLNTAPSCHISSTQKLIAMTSRKLVITCHLEIKHLKKENN